MNKQTKRKKIDLMAKAFASVYTGADFDDVFARENSKLNEFKNQLIKVQDYLIDNKKKGNQEIVNVLEDRIADITHMIDDIAVISLGEGDFTIENNLNNSTISIDDEDTIIDGEIYVSQNSKEKKAADSLVENFNLLSGEKGTSLREDVNKFLDSIDYSSIDCEGYRILMNIVDATDSVEYVFSRMELKDDMKEMSEMLDDIIDKDDPDIKALAAFCKEKGYQDMGSVRVFLLNHEKNITAWEAQLQQEIETGKPRKGDIIKRKMFLQGELGKVNAACEDYEKITARVVKLRQTIDSLGKEKFDKLNETEYSEKIDEYKEYLGYEKNNSIKTYEDLTKIAVKELKEQEKEANSEGLIAAYKANLKLESKLKSEIDKLDKLTDKEIIEFNKAELEKKKEDYARMHGVMENIKAKREKYIEDRNTRAERLRDVESFKNPQTDVTVKALKCIAEHLNDKKSFFHKDSDEFTAMKNDLDALNNEKDPSQRKKLMERLIKSSRTYVNAKTKDGTDKNRFTANGKARQNYAEQIIELCGETLEKNDLWETDLDHAVKLQQDIKDCVADPTADRENFKSVVNAKISELNTVPRNTRKVSGLAEPKQKENAVQKKSDDIQIGPR